MRFPLQTLHPFPAQNDPDGAVARANQFALNVVKREGWLAWHDARKVGIGNWQGPGRRAMGGPVGAGHGYLVGERGPELFAPCANGAISAAGATRILRRGDGSFVHDPETVSKNRPTKAISNVRGDTHFSNQCHIHDANNPQQLQRQVEPSFGQLLRQMELAQRGLSSD